MTPVWSLKHSISITYLTSALSSSELLTGWIGHHSRTSQPSRKVNEPISPTHAPRSTIVASNPTISSGVKFDGNGGASSIKRSIKVNLFPMSTERSGADVPRGPSTRFLSQFVILTRNSCSTDIRPAFFVYPSLVITSGPTNRYSARNGALTFAEHTNL